MAEGGQADAEAAANLMALDDIRSELMNTAKNMQETLASIDDETKKAEMEAQMQSLMGTLNKMPAAVEAMSRSASRCSTAKKSAAPSPAPEPGNFAMGQMGEKPVARNVPLGTGLPAAVVIGGDNIRRHRPNSSRNALSSDDDAFIQDDDQPGPDLDTPWPPGGSGGDDDDDFYTPKTPLRSRQPRRSKSADIYKRRAQMHKHPSGLPTPDGSMTPTLPSLMKNRSRDLDTMSVASSMARSVSSTQVSSWKEDEHIQEWYKARKEKEKETAKMKIRRAHKDLNWVLERRTAQIANFRRDRKNEEKADKATVVKEKAHAATGHLKGIVNAAAKLKAVSAGAGGKASGMATLLKQATGGSNNAGENGGGDAAADTQGKDGGEDSLPSVDVPKTNPRPVATLKASMFDRKPKVHHEEESVWLGPGRFVSMTVDKTKKVYDSYDDVQYSTGSTKSTAAYIPSSGSGV